MYGIIRAAKYGFFTTMQTGLTVNEQQLITAYSTNTKEHRIHR